MDYPRDVTMIPASRAGGTKTPAAGGARAILHTTEGPSIVAAVSAYRSHGGWPHLTWNPNTGEIAAHLPASVSASAVENRPGGVETNRYGTVLQIETVGHAADPFTDGPLRGLDRILEWTRANGVPDAWPMGQPLAYGPDERRPGVSPAAYGTGNGNRDAAVWLARGGWYGHSQVPENDHGDPGRIDIVKVTGGAPRPPTNRKRHRMEMAILYVEPGGITLWTPSTMIPFKTPEEAAKVDASVPRVTVSSATFSELLAHQAEYRAGHK